ncbi:MAG: hypothetical protein H6829_09615 [Planctomycetes bacterium]|nr:hypothetical protein [Planctomycetota bacterium]MCB9912633.1 hypothetical protein [Planctomycetota bacterium]HPF15331.1 hypothetical protein [Planctomycetota bacterium]
MAAVTYAPNQAGNQLVPIGPLRPGLDHAIAVTLRHYDRATKTIGDPMDLTGWSNGVFSFGSDNPARDNFQSLIDVPFEFDSDRSSGKIQLTVTHRHLMFVTYSGCVRGYGNFSALSPESLQVALAPAVWFLDVGVS